VAELAQEAGAALVELLALLDLARLDAPRAATARLDVLADVVDGPFASAAADFARALAAGDGAGLDDAAQRFAALGTRLLATEAAVAAAGAHAHQGQRRRQLASLARARELVAGCEGAATPLLAPLEQQAGVATLTAREREVSGLAARGRTSREIAQALGISVRTVDSHLDHAYTKLGINDRADLAAALNSS
jgi:DNA-binding CsgD family transcriptional regulator